MGFLGGQIEKHFEINLTLESVMIVQTKFSLLLLKKSVRNKDRGFTMIEVIVGILLMLAFTLVAVQGMVTATSLRVRSQEVSEASNWVQTDLESVRSTANALNYDTINERYPISSAVTDHSNRCTASASTSGYGQLLKTTVDAITISTKYSNIGNRPYTLSRTTTVNSASPYNVLQITYQLYRGSTATGNSIYQQYTEVIPGASFSCRQSPSS